MKEIEFWVGSLTYGLSRLHDNTICSRYLGVPVAWWQGCHCPQSRAGSKGGHSSYQAQVACFNWSGVLYNWGKEKKPQSWEVFMLFLLPSFTETLPWGELEPFLLEHFQCKMSQSKPRSHPGPGTAVWKVWEATMKKEQCSQMKVRIAYPGSERGLANSRE